MFNGLSLFPLLSVNLARSCCLSIQESADLKNSIIINLIEHELNLSVCVFFRFFG